MAHPFNGFITSTLSPLTSTSYYLSGDIGSTYISAAKSSFAYIPGYYVSEIHKYMSFAAVTVGVILFLLRSFCDPGIVNAKNVLQYIYAYPYDDIINSEKECSTCKIPKTS